MLLFNNITAYTMKPAVVIQLLLLLLLVVIVIVAIDRPAPQRGGGGGEQPSKGMPGGAMPSGEKAPAEEPPRALREVDRLTRNPEKLANAGGRCWKDILERKRS